MVITQEKPKPEVLSEQLRQSSEEFLPQRRGIAALSLLAMSSLELITLFQTGIIKHLPEVPLPGLHMDSQKVNSSSDAYAMFEVPDGIIGLGSYAATLGLAVMGGKDRSRKQPWIPLVLAAHAEVDALWQRQGFETEEPEIEARGRTGWSEDGREARKLRHRINGRCPAGGLDHEHGIAVLHGQCPASVGSRLHDVAAIRNHDASEAFAARAAFAGAVRVLEDRSGGHGVGVAVLALRGGAHAGQGQRRRRGAGHCLTARQHRCAVTPLAHVGLPFRLRPTDRRTALVRADDTAVAV